jgi:hypothetical protein
MQNHEQKSKVKKSEIQDSMDTSNFFLSTLPFSLWADSATWLHVVGPQEIHDNRIYNPF